MQRSGRRTKRKGRIDYRKLSQGDTEWKSDDDDDVKEKPQKAIKEKTNAAGSQSESTLKSAPVETYLMMLYVSLEQEQALKEFFKDNEWPFLKADLSSITDKTGPTLLHQKGFTLAKTGVISVVKQGKGASGSKGTPKAALSAVKREIWNDADCDDGDEYIVIPRKKRRRSKNPFVTVSKKLKLTKTSQDLVSSGAADEPKLDGTESVREDASTGQVGEGEDEINEKTETEITPDGGKHSKSTGSADDEINETVKQSKTVEEIEEDDGEVKEGEEKSTELDENVDEAELYDEDEEEPAIRCWECEEVLADDTDYADHMLHQHCFDVKTGRYYCNACNKYFKQPDYLRDHIKHIHEGKQRKPQSLTRDHVCELCGRGFKRKDQLKEHTSMVHFKKPLNTHECEVCGKKFSRPRLLGYHMNKHIGDKPFECKTCGNSYFSRGGLYVHSRMCQRVNPLVHQCEVCQKSFSNQYAKKIHMVGVHEKNVPAYQCACGTYLKWKSSIKKHRLSCPTKAEVVTEIPRAEYEAGVALTTPKRKIIKVENFQHREEDAQPTEVVVQQEACGEEQQENIVQEVTDERLVQEITGKIADELSKTGKVDISEEKMISETIRNAVLAGDETQVITIPRSSETGSEDNVYYVIVNPASDQQI